MKKLLIIGIDSFTGKHLKLYMEKYDFDVYGTAFKKNENKIFKCDITKTSEIKNILEDLKPDYLINLAGVSFVETKDKEIFYKVNVLAVENILEAITNIKDYKPLKVILVSSATIYGNQEQNILDENLIPNPINHYGISKLAMEQIAKTYFDKLNIIIARPFNYTGVEQSDNFLIPKIIKCFRDKKTEIELGNLNVKREFNDVTFVCEVYKKLFEANIKNEIVNIASNRIISLKDVIKNMNKISGYQINISVNPLFIRENEIINLSGSCNKLFSLIGEIKQKDFYETLEDMYND